MRRTAPEDFKDRNACQGWVPVKELKLFRVWGLEELQQGIQGQYRDNGRKENGDYYIIIWYILWVDFC